MKTPSMVEINHCSIKTSMAYLLQMKQNPLNPHKLIRMRNKKINNTIYLFKTPINQVKNNILIQSRKRHVYTWLIRKEYWGLVTDFWLGCIALCLTWPVLRYWGGGFPVKIPDELFPLGKYKHTITGKYLIIKMNFI